MLIIFDIIAINYHFIGYIYTAHTIKFEAVNKAVKSRLN